MKKTLLLTLSLLMAGAAAWAHPEPPRSNYRVQAVAHQLEDATRHLYDQALYARHGYGGPEKWVLKRLHRFENRAAHFHRQVERYRRDPHHTRRDFYELRDAYYRAGEAVSSVHGSRRLHREFRRIGYLMRELEIHFDGRGYYGRSWDRHDRRRVVPRYEWRFRW